MGSASRRVVSAVSVLALTIGLAVVAPGAAQAGVGTTPRVLINEVYGGGGNSGATRPATSSSCTTAPVPPVDLAGWSVQYARGHRRHLGDHPADRHRSRPAATYLVGEAAGAGGTTVTPTVDVAGTHRDERYGRQGRAGQLHARRCRCAAACSTADAVVDFVGYGTAASDSAGGVPGPGAVQHDLGVPQRDPRQHREQRRRLHRRRADARPARRRADRRPRRTPASKTIAEIQGTGAASPLVGQTVTTDGRRHRGLPDRRFQRLRHPDRRHRRRARPGHPHGLRRDLRLLVRHRRRRRGRRRRLRPGHGPGQRVHRAHRDHLGRGRPTSSLLDRPARRSPPATAALAGDGRRTRVARVDAVPARPGTYTVTNTFSTNQFGEVGLAVGTTPLIQPTEVGPRRARRRPPPSPPTTPLARVTLDDGASTNFLSAANSGLTPPYISLTNPVRVGAPATFTDAVDRRLPQQRLEAPADRPGAPAAPARPGDLREHPHHGTRRRAHRRGDLKVASFNVLNYFTTLGADVAGCTSFNDRAGDPITVNSCPGNGPRGAWDADEPRSVSRTRSSRRSTRSTPTSSA